MGELLILFAIFFPLIISPLFLWLERREFQNPGLVGASISLLCFGAVIGAWLLQLPEPEATYVVPWVPSLGINLSFLVDGLSLFFAQLVTGMGILVHFYANFYMDPKEKGVGRFYCCLTFFMGAMLGTVFSDNLMLLYLFWELTGIASYLLIAYHRDQTKAAQNARLSLLVTFATGIFLFLGIILIGILDETFRFTEIIAKGINFSGHEFWGVVIVLFFLVGIFGKSAQLPFHFWLPKAMVAPIPVSAYLHAATMVKLGIYLTARVYPLFVNLELWFPTVTTICYATMLFGAVLSLISNDLKVILAYATISQLGFFIGFYGMGGVEGVRFDFVHIFNHALYKGSLFMLVGVITKATGIRDIRYLGGLWHRLPLTTVAFLLAAGAMAGIPGTTGFLSKELILTDILGREWNGGIALIFLVLISAMIFKVAFSLRLFFHIFVRTHGVERFEIERPSIALQISPLILSIMAFIFGVWPDGLEYMTGALFVTSLHLEQPPEIALLHGWQLETFVSFGILTAGALLFYAAEKSNLWWRKLNIPDWGNFCERVIERLPSWGERVTSLIHPRTQNATLFLLMIGFIITMFYPLLGVPFSIREFSYGWMRLTISLLILISTLGTVIFAGKLVKLISLSIVGFLVTLYFVFYAAPDLAMTQLLVEVLTLLILILVFMTTGDEDLRPSFGGRTVLRIAIASGVGMAAAWASWVFYNPLKDPTLTPFFVQFSEPLAKGKNLVNTILVDFRGLDTLGETTVLLITAIGVWKMLRDKQTSKNKIVLIPSIILKAMIPLVFVLINMIAIYLLLKGHDSPGGGFIAGLASGISVVLLSMIYQSRQLFLDTRFNVSRIGAAGLILMIATALFPLFAGQTFLTHYVWGVSTPLLFDIGIYFTVIGVTMKIYFSMRLNLVEGGPRAI